jgi:hypothetical protein
LTQLRHIVVALPPPDLNPREYRMAFVENVREAIIEAYGSDVVDIAHAEELWRAIPTPAEGPEPIRSVLDRVMGKLSVLREMRRMRGLP